MKEEQQHDTPDLLRRLNTADAGSAWVEFLDRYAQLIINTAGQFEYGQGRINDCFLFACEKLNDNGFRRLLKFNTNGKAKFRTWLTSVVFNLCVDWHRQEYGRVRLLPAIEALPAFDRSVYHLVVEQRMTKEFCFQKLSDDFPDLDREAVAKSLGRIYSILTPRQRWQTRIRGKADRPSSTDPFQGKVELLTDPGPGPDAAAESQQELDILHRAVASLPLDQRLLLRLRFQEGLSLEKIADLKHLGDSNRAWRHIQAAMSALSKRIRATNSTSQRKN